MASKCAKLLGGVLPFLLAAGASSAFATDAPRQLNWADLVPKNVVAAPLKAKSFFGGSTPMPDGGPPPPPLAEGKFMSVKRRQPGSDRPPAVVPGTRRTERFDRRLCRAARLRFDDSKGISCSCRSSAPASTCRRRRQTRSST